LLCPVIYSFELTRKSIKLMRIKNNYIVFWHLKNLHKIPLKNNHLEIIILVTIFIVLIKHWKLPVKYTPLIYKTLITISHFLKLTLTLLPNLSSYLNRIPWQSAAQSRLFTPITCSVSEPEIVVPAQL